MVARIDDTQVHVYYCRNSADDGAIAPALARLELRDDVVLEPVPCSGKVDPRYLLKAFESGAGAVCILACPKGHCKMMEGNLRATNRISLVRELMAEAGLDSGFLRIFIPDGPGREKVGAAAEQLARFVDRQRLPAQGVAAL